jgi:hypothetical protein
MKKTNRKGSAGEKKVPGSRNLEISTIDPRMAEKSSNCRRNMI